MAKEDAIKPRDDESSRTDRFSMPEFPELVESIPANLGKTKRLTRLQVEELIGKKPVSSLTSVEKKRLVASGVASVKVIIEDQTDPLNSESGITVAGISPEDTTLSGELPDHPHSPPPPLPKDTVARESLPTDGNAHLILNDRNAEELRMVRGQMNKKNASLFKEQKREIPHTYKIEKELGRGGYGAVFLAKDPLNPTGEEIAVKIVVASDKEARERLKRQMQVMAQLGNIDGMLEGRVLRPLHPNERIDLNALGRSESERDNIFIEETLPIKGKDLLEISEEDQPVLRMMENRNLIPLSTHNDIKSALESVYSGRGEKYLSLLHELTLSGGRKLKELKSDSRLSEQLSDEDNRQIAETIGNIHENIVIDIGIESLQILSKVHEQGIAHRDFKPANIMIDEKTGKLTLIDWGLVTSYVDAQGNPKTSSATTRQNADTIGAKIAQDPSLTSPDDVLGTPYFMVPEYITGEGVHDDSGDRWAVAVSLYNLLTDKYPFEGRNVLEKIIRSTPTQIRDYRPNTSPAFAEVLEKAMNYNRDGRYKTDEEMIQALENCKHTSAVKAYAT